MRRARELRRCGVIVLSLLGTALLPGCGARAAQPADSSLPAPAVAEAATAQACRPAPLTTRAARTLVVGLPDTTSPDDVLAGLVPALGVGGVLLTQRNVTSAPQVRTLIAGIRQSSHDPLLVTIDEEGGRVSSLLPVIGPSRSAREQAALGPAAVTSRVTELARTLHDLGLTGDLAPDADVDGGPWDGSIGDRSPSASPTGAGQDAVIAARALAAGGILPAVKHFPGLGRARADTHVTDPVVDTDLTTLRSTDLLPFVAAVRAGVPMVMVGHARYAALGDGLPASVSPAAYRLLRRTGFTGVAITDSIGMGAVNLRFGYGEAAVRALAAGADAVLATDGTKTVEMRDAIVAAVRSGRLPEQRLNEAAARVARLGGADPIRITCRDAVLPSLTR